MTFVHTVAEQDAGAAVAAMYDADRDAAGHVPNYTRAFSARPDVYAAWKALSGAIKGHMDARRYELVSVAAARRLRSSYCALAHGSVLLDRGLLDAGALEAMVTDPACAGLDAVDRAVIDLADQVAADATQVTEQHVARLRDLGLADDEITDIVLAAALRCFFAKALDGLGAQPDARFAALEPGLRTALTVGRPIAEGDG